MKPDRDVLRVWETGRWNGPYDYQFSVWPEGETWDNAVIEIFRQFSRVVVTTTESDFDSLRSALERNGLTLREATRTPHFPPEDIAERYGPRQEREAG